MFILMAIIFGFFVYRRNAPLGISTVIGVIGIAVCMYIGLNWHPIYLSGNVWMIIVGLYIAIASVTPVWILLQPRDYLSSFLLYGMMILAVVGIIGCHPDVDMPAFTGFYDTLAPSGTSLGYMFPALFVTIACGAVSGFHSLVGSGTTAKQLDQEKDAKPIAYGGMLIECALALISVCAVGYIWAQYADGTTVTPTVVFATGLASMFSKVFGAGCYNVVYSMLILAVSAFCLTSVDTATRLARYMFQEFFTDPGETREDLHRLEEGHHQPLCGHRHHRGGRRGSGPDRLCQDLGSVRRCQPAAGCPGSAGCVLLAGQGRPQQQDVLLPHVLHADRDPDLSGVHHQGSGRRHHWPAARVLPGSTSVRIIAILLVVLAIDAGGGGHPGPVPQQQEGCRCQITAA